MEFLGQVVGIEDPDKLERVQVRIPELYDGVQDSDLPWARPKRFSIMGNTSASGVFGVPTLYSWVVVELDNGDPNLPKYSSAPTVMGALKTLMSTNYPYRYGFGDENNNYFLVDRKTNDIILNHKSGTQITVDGNGNVSVSTGSENTSISSNKVTITTQGDTDINASGSVNVTANSNAKVEAQTVNVECGQANVTAEEQVTIKAINTQVQGPLQVIGPITSTISVTAPAVEAETVAASESVSDSGGKMSALRTAYDAHTHVAPGGGGTTSTTSNPV